MPEVQISLDDLRHSLEHLFFAVFKVVTVVFFLVRPYVALISWLAFWTLAVNWVKLYDVLFKKGGIVGLLLMCFMCILIWGLIAPPADGFHALLGMKLSNFVAKTVFVSSLVTIMFLCGSVQLSGSVAGWTNFAEPVDEPAHGHSHDDHGHGHAAADHGHDAHAPAGGHAH